jgi:NADPH-dependent curcumin reductase CurA
MPSYTSIHLAERPQDGIVAGKTFTPKQHPVPSASSLKDGEVLFQTLYLSLDPAMRGWLNPTRSYIPPVEIGAVMRGLGIGLIVASKSSKFPVGTYAKAMCGWTEYIVMKEKDVELLDLPEGAVPTDELGVLGMTGLTAYFGILEIGQVKKGDFVVVSGAAGATGSVVGQIAKLKGAKVLGLAGEDSKVAWLKETLGFDEALNYKDPEFAKKFRAATKGLIDVYFDNVGGEILDMALSRAKPFSRFVMCGAISDYNKKKAAGLKVCGQDDSAVMMLTAYKNYMMIISMRIRMQGFVVFDFANKYAEARKELMQWLSEGKIKRKETIVEGGITKAEEALVGLFEGKNTGMFVGTWSDADVKTNDCRQNHGKGGRCRGCQGEVVGDMILKRTFFSLTHLDSMSLMSVNAWLMNCLAVCAIDKICSASPSANGPCTQLLHRQQP